MPHFLSLGAQILFVLRVGGNLHPHAILDAETVATQATVLCRVIGHQLHVGDAQIGQYLGPDAILARIDRKAQILIGLDSVPAHVLQRVRAHFVGQAYATTFLPAEVDENATALLCDRFHGKVQLWPAVASQRAKYIARAALGMDSNENRLLLTVKRPAQHESQVLVVVEHRPIRVGIENSVARGQPRRRVANALDQLFRRTSVAYQVGNGGEDEVVLLAKLDEVGQASH
mmetsp:Transcript_29559/g.71900  ORF Transcript_29559/g.71900 Transcript_29559/m.71900 type:complete len:230 (+) Transcript_29559:2080-2769(+)